MNTARDFRYIVRWQGAPASDLQEEITLMRQSLLLAENSPENSFFHADSPALTDGLRADLQYAVEELERAERREDDEESADFKLPFEKLESVYFCSLLIDDSYRVQEFVIDNDSVISTMASTEKAGVTPNCTKEEFLRMLKEADLSQYRGSHDYNPEAGYPPFVLRLIFRDEEEPFIIRYWQDVPQELLSLGDWLRYGCFMPAIEADGASVWE